jgi:hypothetical protein
MTDSSDKPLTPRQQRFVERYAETLNGAKAAVEAGYSRRSAKEEAARLLTKDNVRAAIREHQKRLADATFVEAAHVIRDLASIAFADVNELMAITRNCCRYCYGRAGAYQWADPGEFSEALAAFRREIASLPPEQHALAMEAAPEAVGGYGFDSRREPHADCPRCRGDGVEVVWRADTTRLTGSARRLYAGFRQTKDGVNILLRDQDRALEMLGRHLGMFADRLQLRGDPQNPIALLVAQVQGSAIKPVANPDGDA